MGEHEHGVAAVAGEHGIRVMLEELATDLPTGDTFVRLHRLCISVQEVLLLRALVLFRQVFRNHLLNPRWILNSYQLDSEHVIWSSQARLPLPLYVVQSKINFCVAARLLNYNSALNSLYGVYFPHFPPDPWHRLIDDPQQRCPLRCLSMACLWDSPAPLRGVPTG